MNDNNQQARLVKIHQMPDKTDKVVFTWQDANGNKTRRSLHITFDDCKDSGAMYWDIYAYEDGIYPLPGWCVKEPCQLDIIELANLIYMLQDRHEIIAKAREPRKKRNLILWCCQRMVLDPISCLAFEFDKIARYGDSRKADWWGHRIKVSN